MTTNHDALAPAFATRLLTWANHGMPTGYGGSDMMRADLTAALALLQHRVEAQAEREAEISRQRTPERAAELAEARAYFFGQAVIKQASTPAAAPPAERQDQATVSDTSPIASLTVLDGKITSARFYTPGLPDGEHDVWPCPVSPAPQGERQEVREAAVNACMTIAKDVRNAEVVRMTAANCARAVSAALSQAPKGQG